MFGTIFALFKAGGILQFFDNVEISCGKCYKVYAGAVISHALLIFVLESLELRNTTKVYEELLDQLIFFPVHFVTIIKSLVLCVKYKKVNRIMKDLDFEYDFFVSSGEEFKRKIENGVRKMRIVSVGYTYLILGMSVLTTGYRLLRIILLSPYQFTSGEVVCRKMLVLYSVIPFPTFTKWSCVAAYIFQMSAVVVYVIHILACDTFFVILLLYLNIDAQILRHLFVTVQRRSLEKLNLPKKYDLFHDEMYPELGIVVHLEMKRATMSLQRLLRISSDVEDIFQYIAFTQVIFSLFNLMCCLVIAATIETYSSDFFVQVQVYFALAMQLSIYCVFAHNTSVAFSGIQFAIYENYYPSINKSLKKMIIINFMRMSKPVLFTAGKFVPLTLPLLLKILRMSYSFYTVMRK